MRENNDISENPTVKRPKHSIAEGGYCMVCCEDLTITNYAEYLPYPPEDGSVNEMEWEKEGWLPSPYCSNCIETEFLPKQWGRWIEGFQKATCKAEQRRILTPGPPINLKDEKGMPCPNDGEVYKLWYSKDNAQKVAKLEGSLVGEVSELFFNKSHWFTGLMKVLLYEIIGAIELLG